VQNARDYSQDQEERCEFAQADIALVDTTILNEREVCGRPV
jgi:hypothetical protein